MYILYIAWDVVSVAKFLRLTKYSGSTYRLHDRESARAYVTSYLRPISNATGHGSSSPHIPSSPSFYHVRLLFLFLYLYLSISFG